MATPPGDGKQLLSRSVLGGRTVCLVCDLWSVGRLRFFRGRRASRAPISSISKGSSGLGRSVSGSDVSRRACRACRGGGDTVVAPAVYFRAEHLGSRATPVIMPKVPRGRTQGGHRCVQDGISWFEVVSRQPRLHGSRIGGTRSSAATSRAELQPEPAWSGTRSRYDGGRITTSLKTSVLGGRPKRASAYPTDRMLGGAGSGRSSPRSMGLPVATPGVRARLRRSRQGFLSELASRSIDVRGSWWTSSTLSAARPSFSRGARVGCRVHPGACIQVCFGAQQAGRLPTFELAQRR